MGARGRKRRRADGSVASGKQKPSSVLLDPVPADTLAEAVAIGLRYADAELGHGFDYTDSMFDELNDLAERRAIDVVALGTRAEKLVEALDRPENQGLLTVHAGGRDISIDPALLNFAASSPVDDSSQPLRWPGK